MVNADRDRQVVRLSAAILVANIVVAAGKLVYGVTLGSLAIRADGFHSLLDGINNVVIILAMSVAGKPADATHPYGHRKIELLASLFIGVMFAALIYRTASEAIRSLGGASPAVLGREAYAVVIVTLVINVAVAVGEHVAGKRLKSELLVADARHTMSDVFVSLAVLTGIVLNRNGFERADAGSAIVVIAVIAWVGYGVVRGAISGLADETGLPPDEIATLVQGITGVREARRVRSRRYGHEIKVDLTIAVDATITVAEAHAIADAVEGAIRARWAEAADTVVHIEPS